MASAGKPDIFAYQDFRRYLADLYAYIHGLDAAFNKSHVCKSMGMGKSRSYFQDVLNGKFVSKPKAEDFIRVFSLDKDEARYFRLMVNFEQATGSPEERDWYFGQILAQAKVPQRLIKSGEYAYYREWYFPAVRAILNIHDLGDDPGQLAALVLPPITAKQAKGALELLARLRLIRKNAKGHWKPSEKHLTTGTGADDAIIRQFQLKSLTAAQKALMQGGKFQQRVITRTVTLSEKGLRALQARIKAFSAEVSALIDADEEPADRAYQLDLLLYPCSKPKRLP